MSESIAEMVLPGTYVEVRAEGLIGVGAIATGNIGIVGTAARGAVDQVVTLGSYADALDAFGAYDAFSAANQLTLTRALEQVFGAGGRNVWAVRAANGAPAAATLAVQASGNQPGFTLTATSAGTWAHAVTANLVAEPGPPATFRLTLAYRNVRETYEGATVGDLRTAVLAAQAPAGSAPRTLFTAGAVSNAASAPVTLADAHPEGGTDGAAVTTVDLGRALALLEDQPVNIVTVAGGAANVVGNLLLSHVERTENDGRDRIAVVGARSPGTASAAAEVLDDAGSLGDDRVVLCAPGIVATDAAAGAAVTLPPAYTAAAVAGRLATVAPHISLTNKTVPVTPDVRYSTPLTQSLLQAGVLVVRRKFGSQVVKAITTQAGPFSQISIRRIVDYAKAGVRSGSDPYIGRLNNARVRAALKATLDGFLSQMVLDEMLVDYQLEVSATRAQEIRGIAAVVMTLRPTFSIDFIRVTMNLE
jgi:hypothetical protein